MPAPSYNPANIRELRFAMGRVRQSNIQTPNAAADLISFTKTDTTIGRPVLTTENDAAEIGKGNEWATEVLPVAWDVPQRDMTQYMTAEWAAVAFAMALGNIVTVETPAGNGAGMSGGSNPYYTHTIVPQVGASGGIELPYFSMYESVRKGANSVFDYVTVGNSMSGLRMHVGSGPGRQNSTLTGSIVGSGIYQETPTIVYPALQTQYPLLSSSLAMVGADGVNYITSRGLISADLSYMNQPRMDAGYFPGSGLQAAGTSTAAVRGRMEYGNDRMVSMQIVARYTKESTELQTATSLTRGALNFSLSGATIPNTTAVRSISISMPAVVYSSAVLGETDGLVTISIGATPLFDSTNGVMTVTVVTDLPTVG